MPSSIFAERGILAIEELAVLVHDEELAARGVGDCARAMDSTPRLWLRLFFTPLSLNCP